MTLKEYELTDEQLAALYEASKPVPYMVFGGRPPPTPYQNAMNAWAKIGDEMGFYALTVVPSPGKSDNFFLAEPKPKPLVVEGTDIFIEGTATVIYEGKNDEPTNNP